MRRPLLFRLALLALLVSAAVLLISTDYYTNLPDRLSQHETIVLGQNRFVPGSQAVLRVVVRDSRDAAPLSNAGIKVALQRSDGGATIPLFTGTTDRQGTADVTFQVPADVEGGHALVVETASSLGIDRIEQSVSLKRDYRILLSTDKPLYQPGQVIHVRALALSPFDLKPAAGRELNITIVDGKGNQVFRKTLTTSEYGVASTDFRLASEVNTGAYRISAELGETSSEKTVTVERYTLPKFEIELKTERAFYQPGERVRGMLHAGYFFGKPVADSAVHLEGYIFDVERTVTFNLKGTTDAEGNFAFEFDLPAYLAGSDLDGGLGRYYVQTTITDQAQQTEVVNLSFPISDSLLVIEAVPESGQFRPGVENILYILTSTPDGQPAETSLTLTLHETGQTLAAQTDAYGLAEVRLTPSSTQQFITIQANAANGTSVSRDFQFEAGPSGETVLLRPDHPAYRVGETMHLTILTSQSTGNAYLDIVRDGQTISTRSVKVLDGRAEVAVDLGPDLFGTLELHAYNILRSGSIVRDTRLVLVDDASDLSLTLAPDRNVYRPGETAGLDIQVKGTDGNGAQSAIGLAIVDEAVFALVEQDPGFARLYFLLEQELLQSRYDLHGFSTARLVDDELASDPALRQAQENAARAALADVARHTGDFSLHANSHEQTIQRASEIQAAYFTDLSKGLYLLALILPLPIGVLSIQSLEQQKHLGRSFGLTLLFGVLLCPLIALSGLRGGSDLPALLGLFGVLGGLALFVKAWQRNDPSLKWMLALLLVYVVALIGLGEATSHTRFFPGYDVNVLAVLGLIGVVLAFLMQLAGLMFGADAANAINTLLVLLLVGAIVASGCAPAALPTAAPQLAAATEAPATVEIDSATKSTAEPPRLRQYFPETMLWLPDAVTDENGQLHLDVPIADSITTWRMTALASTRDGRLGSATGGLRVFQDFFIDLNLPSALTVGDEVSLPVGVFNYLPEPQSVRLVVEPAGWFELLDDAEKTIVIQANDVSVAYFRIRATAFGTHAFKVTAWGSQMSDAIQKNVDVFPDGKQVFFTQSNRLAAGEHITRSIVIPPEAIPGTQSITVKIYPGVLSQVVEGLDSILRMPNGCFEQTSSTTYPNVLVLDYLRAADQIAPETQLKAEEYINLGYQRLTTFEVDGGGFSLFGEHPADRMLTAYGLQEFGDMGRVHSVDPALVARAAGWLFSQQQSDGSWANDRGLVHEDTWVKLGDDRLPVTAYVVWSMIDAGFGDDPRTQRGLAYLREFENQVEDAYVMALVANALVAADVQSSDSLDAATEAVLARLAERAVREGDHVSWSSGIATFMGSRGQTGSIETTALATLAFLRAGTYPDLANAALATLIQQKDSFGTWYSTQATVLALKALIQSTRASGENENATVRVTLDGQTRLIQITPENAGVVQLLTFNDVGIGGASTLEISATGQGHLMYQVSGSYYVPWKDAPRFDEPGEDGEGVSIDVAYDRTELSVDDTVTVNVTVGLNQPGRAESVLIDLGLPPGFSVEAEDLAARVARDNDVPADYNGSTIERYELTGRQLLVYIRNLSQGSPLSFSYRLRARFPLAAQTPASLAYDYYNPDISGEVTPQRLVVAP